MTKNDLKILTSVLVLVALVVVGMLLMPRPPQPGEVEQVVSLAGVQMGRFMVGALLTLGVLFVVLLTVATILMPLYVVAIHGQVKRMREAMEKLELLARRQDAREERRR